MSLLWNLKSVKSHNQKEYKEHKHMLSHVVEINTNSLVYHLDIQMCFSALKMKSYCTDVITATILQNVFLCR